MSKGNFIKKSFLFFIVLCISVGAWGQKYEFDNEYFIVTVNLNSKTINVSMGEEILANYSIKSILACNNYDDGGIIFEIKYTDGIKGEKILSDFSKRNECYIFASGSVRLFEGNNLDDSYGIIESSANNQAKFKTLAKYIFDYGLVDNKSSSTTTTPSTPAAQPPSGKIEKVWLEHNVYQSGEKGMKVHVKFSVNDLKGIKSFAMAQLYFNGEQISYTGYAEFTPSYDNSEYSDFIIFVYDGGLYTYAKDYYENINAKVQVIISNGIKSDFIPFAYNKSNRTTY